jgi:hypothetical protein
VLRELLQNADDAKAEHAFIRFETEAFVQGRVASDLPDLSSNVRSLYQPLFTTSNFRALDSSVDHT